MEVIKRKIYLEDSVDRTDNSPTWGTLTATTFYLKIPLVQSIDDMGLFTDIEFIEKTSVSVSPDYSLLINKLSLSGITFPFMTGGESFITAPLSNTEAKTLRLPEKRVTSYYNYGNLKITGATDSKLESVRTYDVVTPYKVGFDMNKATYLNYKNDLINGVDRLTSLDEPKTYVFDASNDISIGTPHQITGLLYSDFTNQDRTILVDNIRRTLPLTKFSYIGEGWNETNSSLSASTKEEYLFGIISPPEIKSDIFIDRGATNVLDVHLRLSEIKNLNQLSKYGNGFYNLKKQ